MSNSKFDARFIRALKNRSAIMAVILAMVRDFDVAEDLFQETMLELVRHKERFDTDRDFLRWAKGVASNMSLRHLRNLYKRPVHLDHPALEAITELVMEEEPAAIWERERAGLQHCLERLPENRRRLFKLRYADNIKGDKLARKAGVRTSSLRTTLARVRRLLRSCVDAYVRRLSLTGDGIYEQ